MNKNTIITAIISSFVFICLIIFTVGLCSFMAGIVPKDTVNIDKKPVTTNKAARKQTAQDVVLPELAGTIDTTDVYMNNFGQFIACVSRDDLTSWLDKNRNTKIVSLTPLNAAGGYTEKIIILYNIGMGGN